MTSFRHAALNTPPVGRELGCLLFVGSIIFPGVTQMLYGMWLGCDSAYVLVGLLQVLCTPLFLGWIWSIIWGMRALSNASVGAAAAQAAAAPAEETATKAVHVIDDEPERDIESAPDSTPMPDAKPVPDAKPAAAPVSTGVPPADNQV